MWNFNLVVPPGTSRTENAGEPAPHQRKLIENPDASAALMANNAAALTIGPMRVFMLPASAVIEAPRAQHQLVWAAAADTSKREGAAEPSSKRS